jgi:D-arginine dehydrogenase
MRTFAKDRTPVVGLDPRIDGFLWLAGQGGYGIQIAPALASIAASIGLGGPVDPVLKVALDPSRLISSHD